MNQLANIDTDLFVVVSELPTEDIKEGKIYCIRDTSSTAQDNNYIEYAYINNKWEKVGQFQAKPDLSGYARLDGAFFSGEVVVAKNFECRSIVDTNEIILNKIRKNDYGNYIKLDNNGPLAEPDLISPHIAYSTNGRTVDVGSEEPFIFTLEDGSTITKLIRVLSTTNS